MTGSGNTVFIKSCHSLYTIPEYTDLKIKEKIGGEPTCYLGKEQSIMYDNNYPNENPATDSPASNTTPASQNVTGTSTPQPGGYYRNTAGESYGRSGAADNPYENHNTNYRYGSTYPNGYMQQNGSASGGQTPKREKHRKAPRLTGYLKKALVCLSLGLIFGVFAGAGIYAVQSLTGRLDTDEREKTVSEAAVNDDAQEAAAPERTDAAQQADESTADSGIKTAAGTAADSQVIVTDVSNVAKEVMPAIVSINSHFTQKMSYFGQSFTNEADSMGSGIIVGENDTELLIATNYHVVEDTEKLTVQFVEGSEVEAVVKGTDADMDLAVIAVPLDSIDSKLRQSIAIATLGDSDSLQVGEPAIAIGNALGYGQSVTAGVISALNRSRQLEEDADPATFIQTDAAINPGNSGGALLNIKGEVIGINSNKIGGTVVEGMGYAIPISAAKPIIADLMLKETKNKVAEDERGYLGISGISVTEYVSATYGMPEGVYISQVYDNTAASNAGLMKGDIITEFDGEAIASMDELQAQLEFYAKGDTVTVTVMSPGNNGYESRKVEVTLGNKVQNG